MRLYEFAGDSVDPLIPKLVAVTDQLKYDLENDIIQPEMSLEDFIEYLQAYDITLDPQDLYDMIKKEPLKDLISNIKGDEVVFKGHGEEEIEQPEDKSADITAQMAQSALK